MTQTLSLPIADDPLSRDLFGQRLAADGQSLRRDRLTTLQLNLGKLCNLACHHCHVEAGPGRTEVMTWGTMRRILGWLDEHRAALPELTTVDLTGGAPEMNPHFRRLVVALRERGLHILDRCNLTILIEPGYEDLPGFLAEHGVEIVASLPCYLESNVDRQRGRGVYHDSIEALRVLNAVGYGRPDSLLTLDLVYNPVGYGLPGDQAALQRDYKTYLAEHYGITFNRLYTITNMPIRRFDHALRRDGRLHDYIDKLVGAHRPANVGAVMCRSLVSVGYRGGVYDCDFNQMLQLPLDGPAGQEEHVVEAESRKLWDFTPHELIAHRITTATHCFGCTAGAGSSCTGALGGE